MYDQDTVRVALLARDGRVTGYTTIDAADADFINQWRWLLRRDGYAARNELVDGRLVCIRLHRALLGLTPGDRREGDHINRNRLDNRRVNLRILTKSTNSQNKSRRRGSSSQHKGVSWHQGRGKWQARATVNGKDVFVGYFTDESEAAEASRRARLRLLPYAVD